MKINGPFVEMILSKFIKEELAKFSFSNGILGLSGGLDSTVSAFLATRALGAEHVTALLMPYGNAFSRDADDAGEVVKLLGIRSHIIDIASSVDAYYAAHPTEEPLLKGNKMARERMSILYDFSEREKALIIGTSNKTELLLGYGTIHGDMACAINPLGDLYKTQVRMLGRHLGIPGKILKKAPTAGLWDGQTDEEELGLTYDEIDEILYPLVDLRQSRTEVLKAGFDPSKTDKIIRMIKNSEFKRQMPPIAKISYRTVGQDFLFPYDWGK